MTLPGTVPNLGDDLRALRKTRGLTLTDVATRLDCSIGWLSQVERGQSNAGIDTLKDLAALYEVPVSLFFGPAPAPIARIRGRHRVRLLVKAPKGVQLQRALADWISSVKAPSRVRLRVDIDPQSFLCCSCPRPNCRWPNCLDRKGQAYQFPCAPLVGLDNLNVFTFADVNGDQGVADHALEAIGPGFVWHVAHRATVFFDDKPDRLILVFFIAFQQDTELMAGWTSLCDLA